MVIGPRVCSRGDPAAIVAERSPGPVRSTDFDEDRWFGAPEAVGYDMADEVIGGPAGAPESGTPA